jgi:hypothetical protein
MRWRIGMRWASRLLAIDSSLRSLDDQQSPTMKITIEYCSM